MNNRSSSLPETAAHYNSLASDYESRWTDYLKHTHRHFLDKLTIDKQDILLDLSCGTGLLAQHIIERCDTFRRMVLNDIAEDMQHLAQKRFKQRSDISFTSLSADNLSFKDESFTKIFCLNAFHNYHNQQDVLGECYRVLKPGGKLFILDWNRSGPFRLKNWLIKRSGPEHIDTKSKRQMHSMLQHHSFNIIKEDAWYHRSWKFFYLIGQK